MHAVHPWYKKRWLYPFYSFLLFTLTFPYTNIWPLAWIALVPLFIFIEQETNKWRLAFLPAGAWIITVVYTSFGFIYYSGLDHLYFVLFMGILFIPFVFMIRGVFTKTAHLSVFWKHALRLLFIPAIWVVYEHIRMVAPLIKVAAGALMGYSQTYNLALLQTASIWGLLGIGWIVVATNYAIAAFVQAKKAKRTCERVLLIIVLIIVGCVHMLGFLLYMAGYHVEKEIKVGIIQPNINLKEFWHQQELAALRAQADRGEEKRRPDIVDILLDLTAKTADENPDIIFFPEWSFPRALNDASSPDVQFIKAQVRDHKIPQVVGALYVPRKHEKYNSSYLLSPQGEIIERYDKMILFPIGEYFPGFQWIENLLNDEQTYQKVSFLLGPREEGERFSLSEYLGTNLMYPGKEHVVFNVNDEFRFSTPICTEDVVASHCQKFVKKGAQFLAVLSNDAWFRASPTLYHHMICSIFRAVENGVSVIRATNTGISAIILPNGKVKRLLRDEKGRDHHFRGYMVESIPITNMSTFYSEFGYLFPFCAYLLVLLTLFLPKSRKM